MASSSGGAGSKTSALSRLENKYSDILDRVGRRDRDKTLEPNENYNPLARSATTHQLLSAKPKLSSSSFNASDRKERTPYRLQKNKSRYLGDSNDSGYLTTASTTNGRLANDSSHLLDDNYPLDYGSSRYRAGAHNYGNNYDHRYQDEYNPSTSRYSRTGEYASSYKPRSGLDYSNYYDGSRLGPRPRNDDFEPTATDTPSSAGARRQRAYGRNKTCESLVSAEGEAMASGRSRYEPPPDVIDTSHSTNSRNRFAHKRPQMTSVGSSTHRAPTTSNELTAEELEILNDDRSSADNAAILLALRDDGQYLEAKKYEERMRLRTELKERMNRYAQEAEKAKELQKLQEEQEKSLKEQVEEHEKELAAKQTVADTVVAPAKKPDTTTSTHNTTTENGKAPEEKAKAKKSRNKKVTTENTDDTTEDTTTSSSDDEDEDDEDEEDDETDTSSDEDNSTKENTTTINNVKTPATTTTSTTSTTTTKPSALVDTTTKSKDQTDANGTNQHNTTADKNNNDLSKYRPQPIPTNNSSTAGLMHSSSSGALAFGGISERLGTTGASASTRTQKPYSGATSRTAAVLSEFENSSLGSTTSSRYPATTRERYALGEITYKPSNHYDPYTSAYTSSSGSRRTGAGLASSSTASSSYQRQQLAAYQQLQQQQQQHYQQNMLTKSATASSLFHRSRIPKTYSSFVRSLFYLIEMFFQFSCVLSFMRSTVLAQRKHTTIRLLSMHAARRNVLLFSEYYGYFFFLFSTFSLQMTVIITTTTKKLHYASINHYYLL